MPQVSIDERKLRELWESGTPLVEMAAVLRLAPATISQNARRLGLAARCRKGKQDDAPDTAEEKASAESLDFAPETKRLMREADGRRYLPCRGGPHDGTIVPDVSGSGRGFEIGRRYMHWYAKRGDHFAYVGLQAVPSNGWEI